MVRLFDNNERQSTVVGQELRRKYRELGRSPSWAVHAKMHWKHAARAAKICAGRAKLIEQQQQNNKNKWQPLVSQFGKILIIFFSTEKFARNLVTFYCMHMIFWKSIFQIQFHILSLMVIWALGCQLQSLKKRSSFSNDDFLFHKQSIRDSVPILDTCV